LTTTSTSFLFLSLLNADVVQCIHVSCGLVARQGLCWLIFCCAECFVQMSQIYNVRRFCLILSWLEFSNYPSKKWSNVIMSSKLIPNI
jgi:hypothetical protein